MATGAAAATVAKGDVILVVGSTGGTGKLIVRDLLAQNYTVKAMVRDLDRGREALGDNVPLVKADLTDKPSLAAAFEGVGVVINTAGAGLKSKGKATPEWIDYKGTVHLVDLAKENNIKKFVLISSMGVTQEDHFLNRIANDVLKWKFKGEEALRASGVTYSIIRPGGLTNKPGPEQVVQFYQGDQLKGGPIRREDVSRVVLAALQSSSADNKSYEIMAVVGERVEDFEPRFKALKAD
ncbi:hypothetical protein BST96_04065 [Oceanicoccus sagamiensis]|uniref:NAD(P)-binding domain-containing protein n=2 Tax=Oceanicoccus sagamiensis TaxID=716816 RepID=A0A1X9NKF2_9GAMM|nr:hypothetical protein BST96_04065 [Oceanicoccus sagamiensis]